MLVFILSFCVRPASRPQIEVQSQAYQPNQGLPGYNDAPSTYNNITLSIFRRTPSTDATLAGLVLLDTFNASQTYALNRPVASNLYDYRTATLVYYNTSELQLQIVTKDTT